MKVSVVVGGSWGTALAAVLADNGHQVSLWIRSQKQMDEINQRHQNSKYLGDAELPLSLKATTSMEDCLSGSDAVLLAAHSAIMRDIAKLAKPYMHPSMLLIHAAKGLETDSLLRMSSVLAEELPDYPESHITVLSGPSHAEEVVHKYPTTVTVAAHNADAAERAQGLFINSYFRVYTNADVIGVEIGGAMKNIIALGAGLSDGLGFGDNAKAALMTRGLAEISRLGMAMGANPLTFSGLAGVGDLIVTCTSQLSRNWKAGYQIGQGKSLSDVLEQMGMVVEGVRTTHSACRLAEKHQVELPIARELHAVLFEGKPPREAVEDLMGRGRTNEIDTIDPSARTKWL